MPGYLKLNEMADLKVTVGADVAALDAGMKQASRTVSQFSSDATKSLTQSARSLDALGGSAQSASMRFQQMRSGISAARDGVLAFTVGGQAAERSLLAMGHHINSLVNETGSFRGAMGALVSSLAGPGGIILALSVAAELFSKYEDAQKKAAETQSSFQKANDSSAQSAGDELTKVTMLYDATQNLNLSHSQRLSAVKELQSLYPSYFGNLSQEAILAGKAAGAYDALTQSLFNKAAIEGASAPLKDLFKQLTEIKSQQRQMASGADELSQKIGLKPGQIKNSGFMIDNSTDAKDKGEMVDVNSVEKRLVDQIRTARIAMQDMLSNMGVGSLITKDDINSIEAIREEIKRLQLDILAHPENKDADLLQIVKLKKQLEELNPSVKKSKDGLALLQEELSKAEKVLENSVIAGKTGDTDYESPLLRHVLKLQRAIQNVKDTISGLDAGLQAQGLGSERGMGGNMDAGGLLPNSGVHSPSSKDLTNGGLGNHEQTVIAMKKGVEELGKYNDEVLKSADDQRKFESSQKLATQAVHLFGTGLENVFSNALSGTQGFVQGMVQFLEQLIIKFVAAAAAAEVLNLVTGGTLSGFTSIFGQLSGLKNLAGSDTAGSLTHETGHADAPMATGGVVMKPTRALVGEAGPEAVIPLNRWKDFKNNNNGNQSFTVTHKLSGSDLLLVINRATKQKNQLT